MSRPEVACSTSAEGVTVVTLDRPERRNALGWQTWEELEATLAAIHDDASSRVVVLTGAGGCFSAGGDLRSSPAAGEGIGAPSARLLVGQRVVDRLWRMPKVTVAAVEGPAVGAGWSLALACDLTVASEAAFFAAPFLARGLVPDGGLAWFLARSVGARRAAELVLTGRRLGSDEAQAIGLVSRVVPDGQALPAALELAGELADGAVDAQALTKRLLRMAGDLALERFLEAEWLAVTLDLHGAEPAEGRSAFAEGRPPRFREVPR